MNKTIISLDSWQIKAFETCPESFSLAFRENLRKIWIADTKRYTDKGTLVHSILGIYYTLRALDPKTDRLKHGTATISLVKKNKLVQKAGFDADFEKFVIERFQQYLFTYMNGDFVPTFKNGVVGVEVPFAVKLYEDKYVIFILEGRIDLIGKYAGFGPLFVDHKTQDKISNYYPRKTQFLCYSLATGLEHGMINYFGLQKDLKNGISLRQKLIHIPRSFVETYKEYLIKKVFMPLFFAMKSNKGFEQRWNSCSGNNENSPCQYTMICEAGSNPETQVLIKKQFYEKVASWSPWNELEEAGENGG